MTINISKKKIMYITIAVASVIVLIAAAYALVEQVSSGITAVSAQEATVFDVFEAEAYAVRDERLLYSDMNGTVVASVDNGAKVNEDTVVAAVFSDSQAAQNYSQLSYLTEKLEGYRMIDSQLTLANVDIEALGDKVDDDFEELLDVVYEGEYSQIGEKKLDYLVDISRRQVVTGNDIDCSVQIAQLEQQISAIEASLTPAATVTAGESGYYKNSADGFEGLITEDMVDALTVEKIESALSGQPQEVNSNCVGVIIDDCRWNLVMATATENARKLQEGKKYDIMLDGTDDYTITAVVESIKDEKESGKSVVVFRSNTVDEQIFSARKTNVTVVTAEHTGVYIPSEAVRVVDGKECVYVMLGESAVKRELNIVYASNDYIISQPFTESELKENSELKKIKLVELYDEVIIEGKGLSDDN